MSERRVPGRVHLAAAVIVCAALVSYASLYPFGSRVVPWSIAWRVVVSTWPPAIGSKTDFISNVLLQTPLGFLIAGALAVDRPTHRISAASIAVMSCATLALVLEMAQVSIPARSPQFTDIVAETLGGLIGAAAWIIVGERGLAIVRSWWHAHGTCLLAILLLYTAVWAIWQWLPLDVTIRPAEVAAKYRAGLVTVRPGAQGMSGARVAAIALASLALAVPLGVAAVRVTKHHAHPQRDARLLTSAWIAFVSACQVAVLSRHTSLLLICCSLVGGLLGAAWQVPRARRD